MVRVRVACAHAAPFGFPPPPPHLFVWLHFAFYTLSTRLFYQTRPPTVLPPTVAFAGCSLPQQRTAVARRIAVYRTVCCRRIALTTASFSRPTLTYCARHGCLLVGLVDDAWCKRRTVITATTFACYLYPEPFSCHLPVLPAYRLRHLVLRCRCDASLVCRRLRTALPAVEQHLHLHVMQRYRVLPYATQHLPLHLLFVGVMVGGGRTVDTCLPTPHTPSICLPPPPTTLTPHAPQRCARLDDVKHAVNILPLPPYTDVTAAAPVLPTPTYPLPPLWFQYTAFVRVGPLATPTHLTTPRYTFQATLPPTDTTLCALW